MAVKSNFINLARQEAALRYNFPNAKITRQGDSVLNWEYVLRPTSVSEEYRVKLIYTRNKGVKVFVLEPTLKLAEGKKTLPHVYSTPEQRLCLFYPNGKEWNESKFLIHTIIPWISEWLYFYEIWVGSGVWYGGGTVHDSDIKE